MRPSHSSHHVEGPPLFPLIVTLVHGTFARGAPWTNDEDSVIRTRLREAFHGRVTLRDFQWSGRNSHAARIEAGAALAADQAALAKSHPEIPRFVIAHSHGGNVALYAMRDEATPPPAGIITMGTPFITCAPRDLTAGAPVLRPALAMAAMFAAIMTLGALAALLLVTLQRLASETMVMVAGVLGLLYIPASCIRFAAFVYRRFPRMTAWAAKQQATILERLQLPRSSILKLCIHVRGDEAGAWLRLTRAIGDAPFKLWHKATAVALFLLGTVLNYWFLAQEGISGYGPAATVMISILNSALLAGMGILSYALWWQALMAGFPKLVRSHGLAFGGESLLDNWLVRIATRHVPDVSDGSVTELAYAIPAGAKGLRHSWMYSDAAVADDIADWIRTRLAERPIANNLPDGSSAVYGT